MQTAGRWILRSSSVLLAIFVLIVVLQHLLQPQLSPTDHRISEYATGSPGWLMTVGFAAWSAAFLTAAAAVLSSCLSPKGVALLLAVLLLVAAVCAAATAAYKTGTSAGVLPSGHHLTAANRIHDLGSGGLSLALWGAVISGLTLNDRRFRVQAAVLLGCGLVAAVLLSVSPFGLPGVRQRALVAVACVWQYVLLATITKSWRAHPRAVGSP